MPGLRTTLDESSLKPPSGGAVHSPGIYARAGMDGELGMHTSNGASKPRRPNGPGERSPGLRPEADALGQEHQYRGRLKGRETIVPDFNPTGSVRRNQPHTP